MEELFHTYEKTINAHRYKDQIFMLKRKESFEYINF